MHRSDFDLRQLDEAYLRSLTPEPLYALTLKGVEDLKAARERANQTPQTRSRPPSSRAPWDYGDRDGAEEQPAAASGEEPGAPRERSAGPAAEPRTEAAKQAPVASSRKPGQQPGSPGRGRTQALAPTERQEHFPEHCAACVAYTEPPRLSPTPGAKSWT